MKNYRITVNGVAYDVAVEELGAGEASAAPVSTPAAVPAPAKKAAPKTSGSAGRRRRCTGYNELEHICKIKRRKIYELCCRDNDESRSTDRICILKAR